MNAVTIGADPEVLIRDKKTDALIASCGLIGGSKEKPLPLAKSAYGTKYQEDNVTVEFNFDPVSVTRDSLGNGMASSTAMGAYSEVETFLNKKGFYIDRASEAQFTEVQLDHPDAKRFGCDPDLEAYKNGALRPAINPRAVGNYRFAGGHIHIGYDRKATGVPGFAMIQLVEYLAYLPIMHQDTQRMRRPYYGLAGLYREKPYGVEYRTPSNFWLFQGGGLIDTVAQYAYEIANKPKEARRIWSVVDWKRVQECIDNNDVNDAKALIILGRAHRDSLLLARE